MDRIFELFSTELSAVSVEHLLLCVGLCFVLSLYIILIYRLTYSGVLYSRRFALSLMVLSLVTSVVILAISSNVVLSLGMVGARSIVRFRTAIKDPMDTVFMFWSIVAGIITGAGYVTVAILATLLVGVFFMVIHLVTGRMNSNTYLVVIRYTQQAENAVRSRLNSLGKVKLKSRNENLEETEIVVEAKLTQKNMDALSALLDVEGVADVNVISYNGSTML